jgi:hypothetical protein
MPADESTVHVIVVADDAVEAGMLALDLVQAGFDAHAASDEDTALRQLRDLHRRHANSTPGVVVAFNDLRRSSVLSRRLISSALRCRFIAVVRDSDRQTAQAEASLLDWNGVLSRPPDPESLAALLRPIDAAAQPPDTQAIEEGDLARDPAAAVLQRLLDIVTASPDRHDCVLQLADGERHGQVAFVDGCIAHAQAELDTGRHALERLCCWHHGHWRLTWVRYTGERTIHNGNNAFPAAREYARRVAVARESVPHRNTVCAVRWERVRPLPVVAEAMFHRIAAGTILERALNGEGDDEIEAITALVSRIRRGAVVPQASAVETQPQAGMEYGTETIPEQSKQSVGRRSGYSTVPHPKVAGLPPPQRLATVQKTAAYHRPPSGKVDNDALTRQISPLDIPADLPPTPRSRPNIKTSNGSILPATLPPYESDGVPPVDVGRQSAHDANMPRATGWFGLNVGPEQDLAVVPPAAVVAPERPSAREPAPTVNVSNQIAALPRPRPRQNTDAINATYSDWTDDYAETNKAVEEASVVFHVGDIRTESKGKPWLWAAALVVVAAIGVVILVPELGVFGSEEAVQAESPVMKTYRRAVRLVDEGRRAEAMALLSGVHSNPTIPQEALLQLAVLEIEMERYELGRSHLEHYLDSARALEAPRAQKLYTHVYGKRR